MAITITTQPTPASVIPTSEPADLCIAGTPSSGSDLRRILYVLEKNGQPCTNMRSLVPLAVCKRLNFMEDAKHLLKTTDAPFAIAGDWQPDPLIFDWFQVELEEVTQDTDDCTSETTDTETSNTFGIIASKPGFMNGNPFSGGQAVVLSDRPRCYTIQRGSWDAIWVKLIASTDIVITSYTSDGTVIDTSGASAINHSANPVIAVGTSLQTIDAVHANAAYIRVRIITNSGTIWNNGADRIDYHIYFDDKCEAIDVHFREPFGSWSVEVFKDFELQAGLSFEQFNEQVISVLATRRGQQTGRYSVDEVFTIKFKKRYNKTAEIERLLSQLRWSTAAKIHLRDRFGAAYYQAITIEPGSIFIKPYAGILEVEFEASIVWVV